ncbi:anthranilate synthase component I family protein [Flavitalea sp. BT771]|nr:anthranilate synthase component I family protein [Flavitalea sp. BT771]MDO6435577.1 anthranilate synthase component I family protein [Flavitalea sp. BT771]MDV6224477.1 anthranilate synthase component I family protein [Flavitalea sp. BT771]
MQMLNWASRFNISAFLDNQDYHLPFHSFDGLLAAGAVEYVRASAGHAFEDLREFAGRHHDWLFGHFAYDLVKETEPFGISQQATNPVGFPDLFFFIPEIIIELKGDRLHIGSLRQDHAGILEEILAAPGDGVGRQPMDGAAGGAGTRNAAGSVERGEGPRLQAAFSREEYLETIRTLREHILRGDCYEINFCQEFFSQPTDVDPLQIWQSLSKASPNPFAAFYRLEDKYLLCASPERYLRREGNRVISQPIKGTAPRVPGDPGADRAAGAGLAVSAKDRSENVMVVDLVRNDLSKVCLPGSVRVRELFGIYGFPQVYQMTSTVEGELAPGVDFIDAIQATFPMGSMTGAPKRRVVELIDQYERTSRGLFSGALGYVTPEGDFDFNVIIRSLFYNKTCHYLSYQVGSGITFYSNPEQEYEECLVKAEGIKKALGLRT